MDQLIGTGGRGGRGGRTVGNYVCSAREMFVAAAGAVGIATASVTSFVVSKF
ncbi:diacylglycerol o-acyltransferase [Aspergillus luchuensis]|uniref:Diacylglycerol o-acyltransferase n=1 Tax=Aspergillus kawachii TaxID=1069201 RepID=A0A146FFF1_ASPKA|nr:diacylglycerol o-acyltransferase [Aspergillus luchuensis]